MSAPASGALRRRVTLQAPLDSPDGIGGFTRSWVHVADLWAQVEAPRGATRLQGDRLEQAITHRVTLRWREALTGEMRLLLGTRVLAIRALRDPDGRRAALILDCEETTP